MNMHSKQLQALLFLSTFLLVLPASVKEQEVGALFLVPQTDQLLKPYALIAKDLQPDYVRLAALILVFTSQK